MRPARFAAAALPIVGIAVGVAARSYGDELATCGRGDWPWVGVHTSDDLSPGLASFVGLLRAELASRGIDLCPSLESGMQPPLATIQVSSSPDAVALGVEVRDAVTEKHVSRDVALGGVPADSRPLMIAAAADELLRASWAELALRTAPPPPRPVPVEVTRTVRETLAPPEAAAAPRVLLGVDGALEHFSSGTTLYGADARLQAWSIPRLAAAVRAGLRSGAAVSAADGDVQPSVWILGAAVVGTITPPRDRWGIDAVGRVDVEHVSFLATPRSPATGSTRSDYAVVSGLGPQAWFRLVPTLRIGAEVLALLPLRPVEATDAHTTIAGVSGAGWSATIGLFSTL